MPEHTYHMPVWLCDCGHQDSDHATQPTFQFVFKPDEPRETYPCEVSGCQCSDYTQSDEETARWDNVSER